MSFIIYNGALIAADGACIHHDDRGFTLGHGVFETILVEQGIAPWLSYHWQRLLQSAALLEINQPFTYQVLKDMIITLIKANQLTNKIAAVRLTLSFGRSARGILPSTPLKPNFVLSAALYQPNLQPFFSAWIASTRKNEHSLSARIKSLSYLDNILAKQEAHTKGFHEAILLNTAGLVADAATSTIFMVKDKKIYTPPVLDGALPGVLRAILLTTCQPEFTIYERSLTTQALLNADEVFLSNALMGIQPVHQINQINYRLHITSHTLSIKLNQYKKFIKNKHTN